VTAYLTAHASAVQTAAANTVGQWKTWYWICFGGIIVFLLSIPLLRGRWRTKDAKRDEEEHETLVRRNWPSSTAKRAARATAHPGQPDTVPAPDPGGTVSGIWPSVPGRTGTVFPPERSAEHAGRVRAVSSRALRARKPVEVAERAGSSGIPS